MFLKKEEGRVAGDRDILTMTEMRRTNLIRYDRLQGRPSIELAIAGKAVECLLDTGARINVMSSEIFFSLDTGELRESMEVLRCANNSQLQTLGKTTVEVEIDQSKKMVDFTVVEEMSPDVIGGIQLQEQFGFRLVKMAEEPMPNYLFNIEANFGRKTTDEERLHRAITVLRPEEEDGLLEVIEQNKGSFMADNWDIGCTTLVRHQIKTNGGPINTKPWRQPMHLEGKIKETIKNLYENGIIRKCNSP